jgi:hypothetical protein
MPSYIVSRIDGLIYLTLFSMCVWVLLLLDIILFMADFQPCKGYNSIYKEDNSHKERHSVQNSY